MSPKVFLGLLVVTVIAVVGAGLSVATRYADNAATVDQERLFPDLTRDEADIGTISVQTAKQTLTARNEDGQWSIVERSGYPGSSEKMQRIILALAELRVSEPKTRMEDRYPRLQVEDVTTEGAQSRLLTIADKSGNVLAELIVGRENRAISGPGGTGIYVRKPDEDQAWLAVGVLDVPDEPKEWVDAQIMNVSRDRIRLGTVVQPDGDELVIEKDEPVERGFTLANKPEDREIEHASDVQNVGNALEELEIEDVRRAEEVDFPEDKTIRTEYRTFDGLVVEVESFEGETQEEGFWARYSVSVDEEAAAAAAASAEEGAEAAAPAEGSEGDATTADTAPSDGDADSDAAAPDVHAEAERINQTVTGWAFKIPAYKYRYMARRMDEVLAEVAEGEGS